MKFLKRDFALIMLLILIISCPFEKEKLNSVSDEPGSINVYFNKSAFIRYAMQGNRANYDVNLEKRFLKRIRESTNSIDLATYEINLEKVVDALIEKANEGVKIRVIADAKAPEDSQYVERYTRMRLYLEKMARGKDRVIGSDDDIILFADSPIFAVEDPVKRMKYGLPETPEGVSLDTIPFLSSSITGYMFIDAERKENGEYYSPSDQMHNKFAILDQKWVFTGSWNFTHTGLENQQHVVEVHSTELAAIYQMEFEEMWGSNNMMPDPVVSNFHGRKKDNTPHFLTIGGRNIEVYFSPGDNAIGHVTDLVKHEADSSIHFSIFAWSDQKLVDEIKYKWEASYDSLQGIATGFDVKGVFDSSFWNQWWSASIEMTGRIANQTSSNNPNIRWANIAPVYKDAESQKLHSKTMIIDANTVSDPTVIVGSTNWSQNGNEINDENMLIIHDAKIANQFFQEFMARYQNASGE